MMNFAEITRQVPFLHDKDPKFIEMIAPKMTLLRIADGEYVVKEGERGQDLFFLLTGVVNCEYETDDGENLTLISHETGQYFGDVAMFLLERNITSFKANHPDGEECELYMLSKHDLEVALTGNVEIARDMRDIAQEKMTLMKLQIQVLQQTTPKKTPNAAARTDVLRSTKSAMDLTAEAGGGREVPRGLRNKNTAPFLASTDGKVAETRAEVKNTPSKEPKQASPQIDNVGSSTGLQFHRFRASLDGDVVDTTTGQMLLPPEEEGESPVVNPGGGQSLPGVPDGSG